MPFGLYEYHQKDYRLKAHEIHLCVYIRWCILDRKAFGKRLNKARRDSKLTAAKLAEQCGVDDTHIRHMEGGRKSPSVELLLKLCGILSVSPNYLLQDSMGKSEIDEMVLLSEQTKGLTTAQLAMVNDVVAAIVTHIVDA